MVQHTRCQARPGQARHPHCRVRPVLPVPRLEGPPDRDRPNVLLLRSAVAKLAYSASTACTPAVHTAGSTQLDAALAQHAQPPCRERHAAACVVQSHLHKH